MKREITQAQKEAERLFGKFYYELSQEDGDHTEECTISLLALRCAVACCDEIINQYIDKTSSTPTFYENVKLEIDRLTHKTIIKINDQPTN
jgi:hypothetical protein